MTKRHVAAALVVCAGVVWLYGGVLSSLVSQWASDDDYSHGFFVVPLAVFFAWARRDALRRAALRPSAFGLFVIGASLEFRRLRVRITRSSPSRTIVVGVFA